MGCTRFNGLVSIPLVTVAASVLSLGVLISPLAAQKQDAAEKLPGTIYVQASFERKGADADKPEQVSSILAIDPNTGEFKELGPLGHSVRVSPDGKRLVASQQGGEVDGKTQWDVHVIDLAQFETLNLLENVSRPSWSGDGKQVVYNVGKMGDAVGWRGKAAAFDVASKEVRELGVPETDEVDDWSPDGQWLVTVSDRHPPFGSGYQLYVMHPDGSGQRRLTEGLGLNCYPRFHPDSKQIVYQHQRKGVDTLLIVDVDGTNRREVFKGNQDGTGDPNGACWSPDGKWLAVPRFDWTVEPGGRRIMRNELANHRLEIMSPNGTSRGVVEFQGVSKFTWLGHPDWR